MTYTLNMATTDRVIEDLDSISRYNKTEDVEVIIWYMVVLENPNRDDYSWIPEPFHFLRENIEVESGIEIARKIQSQREVIWIEFILNVIVLLAIVYSRMKRIVLPLHILDQAARVATILRQLTKPQTNLRHLMKSLANRNVRVNLWVCQNFNSVLIIHLESIRNFIIRNRNKVEMYEFVFLNLRAFSSLSTCSIQQTFWVCGLQVKDYCLLQKQRLCLIAFKNLLLYCCERTEKSECWAEKVSHIHHFISSLNRFNKPFGCAIYKWRTIAYYKSSVFVRAGRRISSSTAAKKLIKWVLSRKSLSSSSFVAYHCKYQ